MDPRECLEQLEKAIRENQLTQVKKTLDSEVEFNTEKVSFLDWIK